MTIANPQDKPGAMMAGPKLELTWPHKDEFLLVPKDDDGKPVWVPRDHPAASEVRLTRFVGAEGEVNDKDPHLDNTVFVGDSIDAMRVMCEVPEFATRYRGKVKLIYADPPFNTGQAFTHYDDWMEHATWLSFMRDRLMFMKDLLAPDGAVWIHLDDAEQHRMRCLLDEVFGSVNFVTTIAWEKTDSPRMDAKSFSNRHDYIHVYRRGDAFSVRPLPGGKSNATKVDASGRPYYLNPLRARGGQGSTRAARPNLYFGIEDPDGNLVFPRLPDGTDGAWRWSREKVEREADRIEWTTSSGRWNPNYRIYEDDDRTRPPETLWPFSEVGSTRNSAKEVKDITGGKAFSTPKPERLLERIIHIGSNPGDVVFDPFAGSGTTAAVAHKMGRRWATSELSLDNVNNFVMPRLTKVVKGDDPGGITESVGWSGGGAFRTLMVEPSLYEVGTDGMVFIREDVDSDDLSRAMAGQMRFTFTPEAAPFCGRRGRMLLAVIPGVIGTEEIDDLVARLPENTRLTLAAGALLPGAADHLTKCSRGSRALKIPRDVLTRTLRSATDSKSGETNG